MENLVRPFSERSLAESLVNTIFTKENFRDAFERVKKSGIYVRNKEFSEFEGDLENNLFKIIEECRSGQYIPRPMQNRQMSGRKIEVHSVFDRVVHQAIVNVLYDLFRFGNPSSFDRPNFLEGIKKQRQLGHNWYIEVSSVAYTNSRLISLSLPLALGYFIYDKRLLLLVIQLLEKQEITYSELIQPSRYGTSYLGLLLYNISMSIFDYNINECGLGLLRSNSETLVFFRNEWHAEKTAKHAQSILVDLLKFRPKQYFMPNIVCSVDELLQSLEC